MPATADQGQISVPPDVKNVDDVNAKYGSPRAGVIKPDIAWNTQPIS